MHLTTPWRVVIAGPPNVGKSSLLNAIAGYQRAIVSPLPGTTRDVVTITTAINGWPVQFADTAGLRETQDELESAGVALAGAALEQAELVILVSDASVCASQIDCSDTRYVSALTGQGIAELLVAMERMLVPAAPSAGAAVAFTRHQVAGLEAAREAIDRADIGAAEVALSSVLSTDENVGRRP
jgi:tRNA modification GTPase